METIVEVEKSLTELRQYFKSGKTRSVAWRKNQLRALLNLIHENENAIFKALHQDLGKHPVEAYRDEIGVLEKSATYSLNNIEDWMAPKKGNLPLLFFPARGEVLPEPLGVVLIFSSWNFPISLALDPLIGAISAGNAHKWDKIFFTGSPQVGRIVMSAAANHLTPVTLELGGKCPTILDSLSNPSDLKVAIKRIVGGKWGPCSGQACIGIDYVLVEDKLKTILIESLKRTIKKFYGENPKDSKVIARIVNKQHFKRLCNLLKDPLVAASIVHGGSVDEEKLFIEPTILLDPPHDAEIMMEEIFGPLLPIITLNKIQESIDFINSRPKPLAIYAFTKDETFKKQILSETSSGSVTFNDVLMQFLCDALPFGGVGQSGFGRYHGKYSFDTFSHEKAVMQRHLVLEIGPRYPPWDEFKLKFMRLAYRLNYFGLILLILGLKK
ncbi:Aldehyde dehydrogenase [Quillaja saponaria]|uniref:Aldehyde dehydrogenase n=1 Tax=Quillaja saponaria TaxID=32244 RepID=A0AAD7L7M8_QUISA|nr:Aldehyde dehydrogenase [Quillaja saponaria]